LVVRDGERKFQLHPDVAVRRGARFSILIDTKWKLLDPTMTHEGVGQSDMYQAYAYAREFECPNAILLYPRFGKLGQKVAGYQLHPGNAVSPRIDIKTIDVAQANNRVRSELKQIIEAALDPRGGESTER
jgi:5-methylcytosine-specific restriction enzyme subunit McrC